MRYQLSNRFNAFSVAIFLLANLTLVSSSPTLLAQGRDDRVRDHFRGHHRLPRDPRTAATRPRLPVTIERFRTINGGQNNIAKPGWGKPGNHLIRVATPQYANWIGEPAGADRKGPREISNLIFDQAASATSRRGMTSMVWQWGQFLDHDIDLTEAAVPTESWPIDVPVGDLFFDPFETGIQQIGFSRSEYGITTGVTKPRQQVNFITAWIDGSNVYGSDDETAAELRTFQGGLMRTSAGELLPTDEDGFFLAGDIRANEQVALTSMHTLFVREHNRLAREIAAARPAYNDEQIFLRARRKVIAFMQSITVNEFLPAILGPGALRRYRGYRPDISPKIRNSFSTAAYRFGHSMLPSELWRLNNQGESLTTGALPLRDAFFNPALIQADGIEPYLMGLCSQPCQELDTLIVDDVRNFLFGPPGAGGFDLAALNIQRGRDHGLAHFNSIRIGVGLPRVQSFADITSDLDLMNRLAEAYDFDVNNIDPWVGMLAEDHVPGANVGPTAYAIIRLQFESLRDGDRFWYQGRLNERTLMEVENTRLATIIRRNTNLTQVPDDTFFVPANR